MHNDCLGFYDMRRKNYPIEFIKIRQDLQDEQLDPVILSKLFKKVIGTKSNRFAIPRPSTLYLLPSLIDRWTAPTELTDVCRSRFAPIRGFFHQ